ncbi:hypothetical protein GQ53DRAFT_619355, partial [Thozetella sp. PMI_491]
LTNKIRRIATLIKYTQENQQLFNEAYNKYKKEGKIPATYNIKQIPLDNTTRWNSTYNIIKVTLKLKDLQGQVYTTLNKGLLFIYQIYNK